MAKKDILKLVKELDEYVDKLPEIERSWSRVLQNSMVDPESISDFTKSFSSLENYISNLTSLFHLALQKDISEFSKVCDSNLNLKEKFEEIIKTTEDNSVKVDENEPEVNINETLEIYKISLITQTENCLLVEAVKQFLYYPKSKKNRKKWKNRGLGSLPTVFLPFSRISEKLEELKELLVILED